MVFTFQLLKNFGRPLPRKELTITVFAYPIEPASLDKEKRHRLSMILAQFEATESHAEDSPAAQTREEYNRRVFFACGSPSLRLHQLAQALTMQFQSIWGVPTLLIE